MDLFNQGMEKFQNVSSGEQKYVHVVKSEKSVFNHHSPPNFTKSCSLKNPYFNNFYEDPPDKYAPIENFIQDENVTNINKFSSNFSTSPNRINSLEKIDQLTVNNNSINKNNEINCLSNVDSAEMCVKIENFDDKTPLKREINNKNENFIQNYDNMYGSKSIGDSINKSDNKELISNTSFINKCNVNEEDSTCATDMIEKCQLKDVETSIKANMNGSKKEFSSQVNGNNSELLDKSQSMGSMIKQNTSNEHLDEEDDEDEEEEEDDDEDDEGEEDADTDVNENQKEPKTSSEKIDESVKYVYEKISFNENNSDLSTKLSRPLTLIKPQNITVNSHSNVDSSSKIDSSNSKNLQMAFNKDDSCNIKESEHSQTDKTINETLIALNAKDINNESIVKTGKDKKRKKAKEFDELDEEANEDKVKKKKKKKVKCKNGEKKARVENKKNIFERKNIRKIFEDENLDEETKVAQKEEMERKQRLLEIQEKLKQQAIELRAQREQELAKQKVSDSTFSLAGKSALLNGGITTMSLKNLLETGKKEESEKIEKPDEHDVVEISSSEEDDNKETNKEEDDDLIIMSEGEEEEDGVEDAETSGSHVNDLLNRPDINGCVLVNVGHPPDEDNIFLAPQLASAVKPHQIGGIRFMYDNIVESLERFKTSNGFGCILAHSMGLGKTIQVVSFVDIFLRHTDAKSVLIIVPVNTLQNWINEFNMWMPVVEEDDAFGYNQIDKDILWPREFKLYVINDNLKTTHSRTKIIMDWHKTGGVLLLGYEMYRLLIKTKGIPTKSRRVTKKIQASTEPVIIDVDEEEVNKEIVKNLNEALVRPGPDLVVCDEGHRIKNSHASISQVLKNIRTKRRIVLTGYPLQNNLLEYWCMVDFVRPNYLGSKQEFCNMFERPIMNGQCADSTAKDAKLMRFRAHVLHSLLEGFVQRRGHTVLQSALPQKNEYVLFIRLASIQRTLYRQFMAAIKDSGNLSSWPNTNNPIKAFSVCCKIWNHPDILYQVVEQRKDDNDLDLDEAKGDSQSSSRKNRKGASSRAIAPNGAGQLLKGTEDSNKTLDDMSEDKTGPPTPISTPVSNDRRESQAINYDWALDIMRDYRTGVLEHSGKMVILMDIIEQAVMLGDKILAFSQSLYTLTLIEEYLATRKVPGREEYWQKNRNYFRLDGSTAGIEREKLINQFNDYNNSSIHLFLLSTRAGCLGINLVGACRVVIFDASWNPCHDCQAVCRVYRYGQNKCCSVYRLVSDNTMEKNIYDRQINKQGISDRVVDEMNPQNLLAKKQVDVLMRCDDSDPPELSLDGFESRCSDQVLLNVIHKNKHWLTKEPFTHESLLLDRKDQKLTRKEKKLAKQGYEMEKKMALMGIKQSSMYGKSLDGISMLRLGQQPVGCVRPMLASNLAGGSAVNRVAILNHRNTPRSSGLKPGVSVQQIQTTTDIIIPGTTTISDASSQPTNKIPAGEKVLVIKTPKGVYIRTSQGKIFAVRTAPKLPSTTTTTATTTTASAVASTSNKEDEVMQIDDDDDEGEEAKKITKDSSDDNQVRDKLETKAETSEVESERKFSSTTVEAHTSIPTTTFAASTFKTSSYASTRMINDNPNTSRYSNTNDEKINVELSLSSKSTSNNEGLNCSLAPNSFNLSTTTVASSAVPPLNSSATKPFASSNLDQPPNESSVSSNHNISSTTNNTKIDQIDPQKTYRNSNKFKDNAPCLPNTYSQNFSGQKMTSPPYGGSVDATAAQRKVSSKNLSNNFPDWCKKPGQAMSTSSSVDFNIPPSNNYNSNAFFNDYFKNNNTMQHKQQQLPFNNNNQQSLRAFPPKQHQPSFASQHPSMSPYFPPNLYNNQNPMWPSNPMWAPDNHYPFNNDYPSGLPLSDFGSFPSSDSLPQDFHSFSNSFDNRPFSSLLMASDDNSVRGMAPNYRQNSSYPMISSYPYQPYNSYNLPAPSKPPLFYNVPSSSNTPQPQSNYFSTPYPQNHASFMQPYDFNNSIPPVKKDP